MKKLFLAILAFAALSAAKAADLPARAASPVFAAQPSTDFSWTGFYAGGSLGGLWGSGTDKGFWSLNGKPVAATDPFGKIIPPYKRDATVAGLLAGVQAGYNYQIDRFVVGIEADISGIAATGSQGSTPNYNALLHGPFGASCIVNCLGQTFTSQWKGLGTLRGRVGYAVQPNWMVYGTAGFAEASVQDRYSTILNSAQSNSWRPGWVAGLGTEYAVSKNITFKAEALYVGLGDKTFNYVPLVAGRTAIGNSNKFSDSAVIGRVGVNYKFF